MSLRTLIPVLVIVLLYPFRTPFAKPTPSPVEIPAGHGVSQIGFDLAEAGIVSSSFAFKMSAKLLGADSELKAGRYVFGQPTPIWDVVGRLEAGDFGTKQIKVTVPEGYTNAQISELLGKSIGDSDQGYLFPDTYFFDEFATAEEIRVAMRANFDEKVASTSLENLIMASILEEEVRNKEEMQIVAGILYKRLDLGMPLQVDSVPSTYESRGLPALPVSNPGLQAIDAAKNPIVSSYLYYLSGTDGLTHYAKTFEEHKLNKSRYLR